jgi:hypothetical protein
MTKKEYDRRRFKQFKKLKYRQSKKWRRANKVKWVDYAKRRLERRHAFLAIFKRKPCMDCWGWFEPCQMDFDHRDSKTKYKTVSQLGFANMKVILKEIAKCDLVCANCHRLRTYRRNHAI